MIIKESVLHCVDNTGAIGARCVGVLSFTKNRRVTVGNILKVAIHRYKKKERKPHHNDKEYNKMLLNLKGTYPGLVVTVNKKQRRFGNFFFNSHKNRIVLLNKKGELLGTRVRSFVTRDLLTTTFVEEVFKILVVSRYVL